MKIINIPESDKNKAVFSSVKGKVVSLPDMDAFSKITLSLKIFLGGGILSYFRRFSVIMVFSN
jgi:hypothetical protein